MRLVYCAEPIDFPSSRDWVEAWDEVTDELSRIKDVALDRPARAFQLKFPTETDPRLEAINRAALSMADLLVAVLPDGVASIGVPREIEAAAQMGIPTLVLRDSPRLAFALT